MNHVDHALYKSTLVTGGSRLKQALWFITNSLFLKSSLIPFSGIRVFFLRVFGATVGKNVTIKPGVNIKYPWKLTVGDYSWIGENVWIDNLDKVSIGRSVCLSQGAFILTGNHNYKKTTFDLITAPVIIEDGVWIGAAAIVCPGVVCKTHAVLSVASVAAKNLESYFIYKGNPAIKTSERIISA
jgi:putative colanic acid biosynthesis acetyltransferase WcaF